MASGTTVGGDGGGNDEPKEKQVLSEVKVYRRKAFKGPRNNVLANVVANSGAKEISANGGSGAAAPTSTTAEEQTGSVKERGDNSGNGSEPQVLVSDETDSAQPRDDNSCNASEPLALVSEDTNSAQVHDGDAVEASEPQALVLEDTENVRTREDDASKGSEPQDLVLEDAGNDQTREDDSSKGSELQAVVMEESNSAQPQVDESSKASEVQALPSEDAGCAQPRDDDALMKDSEVQAMESERTDSAQPGDDDSLKISEPQPAALENTDSAQPQQPLEQLEPMDSVQQQQQELEPPSGQQKQQEEPQAPPLPPPLRVDVTSDDSSSLHRQQVDPTASGRGVEEPAGDAAGKDGPDGRIKINLASVSKQEMREIRRKLQNELNTVKMLVKRIEAKQGQLSVSTLSISPPLRRTVLDRGLMRVNSDVGSVGVHREVTTPTPRQTRPLHQLSVSVLQNSQGGSEIVEKEKRTPKANQFYRNSEFLLAKDKFPPAESNRKSKSNHRFGSNHKIFRSCSSVLDKLMKHKHGWVFNTPVDVEGLRLHDYFTIIKHPMDLGTVKGRLNKNWYKTPEEFAEDVRLTFHNAMRYNPKGQDVHIMAEQLLRIFEEKWAVIKSDHERERLATYDMGYPTPTSRKIPALSLPNLDMRRILDRSDSMNYPPIDIRQRPVVTTPSSRTPAPKKPKAKDPHKRDMTYEEKQKLSTNLQSLPSDKLDNIVQIIKKRNSALSQHDDEIEVDIDSVDAETLWELERFVTNYKKNLSKNKRKAELALQARSQMEPNVQQKQAPAPSAADLPKGTKEGENNVPTLSPGQAEKQAANEARSSSSSSSSSDSGSSSSDSDSDSSSASGSDVGH
ncbi:Transcription factor GTE4 [Linum grandiflorum]